MVYGFPIEVCADTMIRAAVDFSKDNSDSMLQKITFIIHPTQAKNSNLFISRLKMFPTKSGPSLPETESAPLPSPRQFNAKRVQTKPPMVTEVAAEVSDKVILRQGGLLDIQV